MKFPIMSSTLMPIITYGNLIFIQTFKFDASKSVQFWNFCFVTLALITASFFLSEWLWFHFRTKIAKEKSAYPFWRKFLGQLLTNAQTVKIGMAWLLFVTFLFASLGWLSNFLIDQSVAHFGFYLALSLLLNFYTAALFIVWHLFLAPRLSVKRKLLSIK